MSHLMQFGFDGRRMLFIPYSSQENWSHCYPHACPYLECDSKGRINGVPYLNRCMINDNPKPATTQTAIESHTSSAPIVAPPPVVVTQRIRLDGATTPPPTKKQKRSRSSNHNTPTPKLVPSANLSDIERSQLHIEIYNYFTWLYSQLTDVETTDGGRNKVRRAGISVPGIQNLMTKLESTFRDVGDFKKKKEKDDEEGENNEEGEGENNDEGDEGEGRAANNGNNGDNNNDGNTANNEKENDVPLLPFLEESMEGDIRLIVEEIQQKNNPQEPAAADAVPTDARNTRDFEIMYERLVAYKERKGHAQVPLKYKEDDVNLGRWVGEIRKRRRILRSRGLDCESAQNAQMYSSGDPYIKLPISAGMLGLSVEFAKSVNGGIITAIDPACTFKEHIKVGDRVVTIDSVRVEKVEDLEVGNDREVRMFGISIKKPFPYTYLSAERVERLDAVGFVWSINKDVKSWDERLAILKQFKETHGEWPSRKEKWNNVGDWVHNQRRYYVQKDKKFMANRAPALDEIGFPWVLRKFASTTSWEDHFQQLVEFQRVNRHFNVPRPEDTDGEDETEAADALRFYKWVQQLHTGYRAHHNGTIGILNEDRIKQLSELGFEFKERIPTTKAKAKKANITETPFEKRLEQIQKFQQELGHLNVDHRYDHWENFGGWALEISKRYKKWQEGNEAISPLEEHQFHQLSALGFEFNVALPAVRSRRSWQENFNAFVEFYTLRGHSNIPVKWKGDVRLGIWVNQQRLEYQLLCQGQPSRLTQERYARLEKAGFLWEAETGGRRTTTTDPTE